MNILEVLLPRIPRWIKSYKKRKAAQAEGAENIPKEVQAEFMSHIK